MSLFAIAAIIVAVIIVLVIVALVVNALTGKSAEDPLASQPGHDHSKGAANCAACQAAAKPANVKVPEKCLVTFRLSPGYNGEYGFDWLREGDTGLSGDVNYENIVGSYGADYATESTAVFTAGSAKFLSLRNGSYNPFTSSWKKDAKGKDYVYATPWISLFPKDQCTGNAKKNEAKLTLNIEVVSKEPEVLRIDYDKDLFELDKKEVTPKSIGKNKMEITIKCLKEFDKDKEIKIFPFKEGEDSLAGKLIVLKNDKANRYKANVVFVKVKTKINAVAKTGSTANENAFLEKYLFQSLTTLNSKEEDLNLIADATFNAQFVIQQDPATNAVSASRKSDGSQIHIYLEAQLSALKPEYNDWYKIFFFDEAGGRITDGAYVGLNGGAKDIPSKSVALYNTHNNSTTTHEILHAMGLYHSFDNDGQYTYKIGETENIMDYSHQAAYGPKTRISTWKWQWDKLHSTLGKE